MDTVDVERSLTRRKFVRVLGLGGAALAAGTACAPAAAPAPAAPAVRTAPGNDPGPGFQAEWDRLVAAAKQDGRLVAVTIGGAAPQRALMDKFQDTFPGISVDQQKDGSINIWGPRALQERQAGIRSFDVVWGGGVTANLGTYKPQGLYQPIRPIIVHPEVLADSAWLGGFDDGFPDTDKKWAFGFTLSKDGGVYINTDLVKDGEIKTIKDLLDPRWKGKIAYGDPRTFGAGYWPATALRVATGSDASVKQFFVDQEVVLSRDPRQIAEWVVRGRYPIGYANIKPVMQELRSQGIGKNVKQILVPELTYMSSDSLWLLANNPNPNAAKLFVNWMLSKDAQAFLSRESVVNSRRKDVPMVDPESAVTEEDTKKVFRPDREAQIPNVEKTIEIAKSVIGQG